jgi:hypothetical protein
MSQKDKILKLLRERGSHGVHSFEFYELRMPRGADAIYRLRKLGYSIEGKDCPFRGEAGGTRYTLVEHGSGDVENSRAVTGENVGIEGKGNAGPAPLDPGEDKAPVVHQQTTGSEVASLQAPDQSSEVLSLFDQRAA